MKDYVLDNVDNVYKVFMERVMKCLIGRNFVEVVSEEHGDVTYVATNLLREQKCEELMKYLMGDVDKL